jgi:hypothetical protein
MPHSIVTIELNLQTIDEVWVSNSEMVYR